MSWWILPTTADIGFRAFAETPEEVFRQSSLALQGIQLSEHGEAVLEGHLRNVSEWSSELPNGDLERGLVRWLEEVLFQGSVENKWLVEMQAVIEEGAVSCQVLWVNSEDVELEVEVKAVTLHNLIFRQVGNHEVVDGVDGVPSFEGPGWMAQVILDI
ncbi:MAG: archease [Candidatus Thalassarchaeaceae archaeon]|jgi:SHS2 domain-containing protein|nr:archease [Candidatus Thalassarchaeaceae archaeon]HJM29469.1 archease [Candidatus Thalassarchaeaceae archaeon]|tara:strand:+ start:4638 stop:5111 length:474 start_codon:yes stop_codon:yes gene_type:complete